MLEYEYAKSEINRFLLVRFYIKLNAAYISSNFHLIYLVNIVGSVSKTGKFERGLLVSCVVVTQIGYIFVAMEEALIVLICPHQMSKGVEKTEGLLELYRLLFFSIYDRYNFQLNLQD
ncbi:hypothetical protein F4703DRAFT_1798843 [Phycomyces blakesleeanus]